MGVESTLLPTDHAVHMNGIETSQAVKCDSIVVEEAGKSVSEEVLQISLENKEDVEFLGTICDLENNKHGVAPEGHKLETETSQAVKCDSTVVEEVGKSVSEEVLQISLENKEDVEFLGTICDLENNKHGVAQAITPPEGHKLEMSTSSEVADETLSSGCQTPRESIFDPFAPGPEEEDGFLQGIRKMFLDLIISNQALEATGKDLIDASPHESCKPPVSKPLLTGIADTCPDAPLRPSLRVVKLSPTICRKLDFGSVSPKSLFVEENEK